MTAIERLAQPAQPARPVRPAARLRTTATLLGPAFVAAVAYVDPGNVATNVAAGSTYGYLLVWVVVAANATAVLVQYLSAKLGVATGRSLPELCAERWPRARLPLWLQAEAVAMATDLAEVVGGALALWLLFGMPLLAGAALTGAVSIVVLAVQSRRGQRPFEGIVVTLLLVVMVGFLWSAWRSGPSPVDLAGGLVPRLDGTDSLLLAAGILGATVMPHAVYLHSALIRDRFGLLTDPAARRRVLAATRVDVVGALAVAGAVNLGLLVVAAAALSGRGVDTVEGAHAGLGAVLGGGVALLFALALLASGLASTAVGTYAGAVILEGFLRVRLSLVVRRLVTLVPALGVLAIGLEPTRALVLSQVVLSFGIPFALVPLVLLTRDRRLMGELVNRGRTTLAAGLAAAVISALNLALLALTALG
jgi:manganese transport protein